MVFVFESACLLKRKPFLLALLGTDARALALAAKLKQVFQIMCDLITTSVAVHVPSMALRFVTHLQPRPISLPRVGKRFFAEILSESVELVSERVYSYAWAHAPASP